MRILTSTVLQEVADAPTQEEKVAILQKYNSPLLRQLLFGALDPSVVFDVAIPVYRENNETDGYASNSLYVESRRLYMFRDSFTTLTATKKSNLLAQILESIDPSDAAMLIKVLKKDVSSYGLTAELVNTAFPDLIKANVLSFDTRFENV